MLRIRTICMVGLAALLGACSTVDTCNEPEFYEDAQGGKRVVVPDDLDGLAATKEMVIPAASPRPSRDRSEGCLDRPPSLRVESEPSE